MPWSVFTQYPGFFSTLFGALLGGGIVWGGTRQMLNQLQIDRDNHSRTLDKHSEEIHEIRLIQKDCITKHQCEKEQDQCHRYICRKIDELIEHTRELQSRSEGNRLTMAQIQEQIKAIERRLYDDQEYHRNSG